MLVYFMWICSLRVMLLTQSPNTQSSYFLEIDQLYVLWQCIVHITDQVYCTYDCRCEVVIMVEGSLIVTYNQVMNMLMMICLPAQPLLGKCCSDPTFCLLLHSNPGITLG